MLAGSGFAGDFVGDPLLSISSGLAYWTDNLKTLLRLIWTEGALPNTGIWVLYIDGKETYNAPAPQQISPTSRTIFPAIAAVVIPPQFNWSSYNPLGSQKLANITSLKRLYRHILRGRYRMDDSTLNRYEVFLGTDAQPDFTQAPWQTFAALPFTTPALAVGHTYYLAVRKRNIHNLSSENVGITTLVINGAGQLVSAPSSPNEFLLTPGANGAGHITASYDYLLDQAAGIAGDTFDVWYTTDGSTPNTSNPPTVSVVMSFSDGQAKLDILTGTTANGTTIKAIVKVRRTGTPNVESANSTVLTILSVANGPAQPVNAQVFLGESARQV